MAVVASIATAAAVTVGAAARAQDAPSGWTQFQGGPGHPGTLAEGPPPPYRERWRLVASDLDDRALSGAIVLDGIVYTVGDRAVYAVDLERGEVEWELPRAGGPLSVPAVVPGRGEDPAVLLYLEGPAGTDGEEDGASPSPGEPDGSPSPEAADSASDLVAVELGERTELWRVALAGPSRTGVTVEGGVAFVGDEAGTVHAVSVSGGEVLWSEEVAAPVDVPLAAAGGLVVAVGRDSDEVTVVVDAFDRDGGGRRWQLAPQATSTAISAAAAQDGRVVVGLTDRFVTALDARGDHAWAHLALSSFSPASAPALDGGTVTIADLTGGVYRLDADDGGRVWGYQLNELIRRSSPVVSGGAVLVGLNDGRLVAIDGGSGRLVWENAPSQGLVGTIALSTDVVVAVKGGRDAGLIAFEHDPDGELVDVPSPTELDPGTTIARAGAAVAIALVVVLVPGYLARRRFGEAFEEEPEDAGELEGDA